jgi:hypothetical protein
VNVLIPFVVGEEVTQPVEHEARQQWVEEGYHEGAEET